MGNHSPIHFPTLSLPPSYSGQTRSINPLLAFCNPFPARMSNHESDTGRKRHFGQMIVTLERRQESSQQQPRSNNRKLADEKGTLHFILNRGAP
ncbi:hypothetical protein XENTR_v10021569 [Xenopus tropicalis]|nr:hypothetical protein XENTR_v10021569 [Xenopus tropicalis]